MQISTGDRTILGKISRRGNRYLRVLFVQASHNANFYLGKARVGRPVGEVLSGG